MGKPKPSLYYSISFLFLINLCEIATTAYLVGIKSCINTQEPVALLSVHACNGLPRYDITALAELNAAKKIQRKPKEIGVRTSTFHKSARDQIAMDFRKLVIEAENNHAEQVTLTLL